MVAGGIQRRLLLALLCPLLLLQLLCASGGWAQSSGEVEKDFPCWSLARESYNCSACVQFHKSCAWCKMKGFDDDNKYSRCDTLPRLMEHGCPDEHIMNPQTIVRTVDDRPLSDTTADGQEAVQLTPQRMRIKLRAGDRVTFPVTFRQALDYPVDLYYLMDLSYSMADDKDNLAKLGDELAAKMRELTKNFRLGFGSFVDKKLVPFVDPRLERANKPCDTCSPPYGFRHEMTLDQNSAIFKTKVNQSRISGNLDAPEGGFDAIMQALACDEAVGWRGQARKMLVVSTDAGFHYAGDGRLAGVVVPNDGQCHLEDNEYTMSLEQDYPSIAQLHSKIQEKKANLIFAVTADQVSLYQRLQGALPDVSSSVGELAGDSSNVVNLITQEYMKISEKIIMVDNANASQGLRISYKTKCKGDKLEETNICDEVRLADQVTFHVTLEHVKCVVGQTQQKITIGPSGLSEVLELDVTVDCTCPCTHDRSAIVPYAAECSGKGHLVCGVCQCLGTNVGRMCECDEPGVSTAELDAKCRRTPDSDICEGRGVCNCGRCACKKRDNALEKITGEYCECDNFNCPRYKGKICNDHGRCECQTCDCDPGFSGYACECAQSTDSCIGLNNKMCSGHGKCICGRCRCDDRYSGTTCDTCATCPTKCVEYRPCVRCQQFNTGPYKNNDTLCDACPFRVIPVDELPEREANRSMIECQFVDQEDDCTFYFMYEYFEEFDNVTVWVKREKVLFLTFHTNNDCRRQMGPKKKLSATLAHIGHRARPYRRHRADRAHTAAGVEAAHAASRPPRVRNVRTGTPHGQMGNGRKSHLLSGDVDFPESNF